MALPWARPLTYDDLREMPDDGHRYELVDGVLIVTPAPGVPHQNIVMALGAMLLSAASADLLVLPAPTDYLISLGTLVQPDLMVVRADEAGTTRIERTPLLVVEVLSPSTRRIDLGTKRLTYEAAGVPAYWLVDPDGASLTVLRLGDDGRYRQEAVVTGDEAYEATWPVTVTAVPNRLNRRD